MARFSLALVSGAAVAMVGLSGCVTQKEGAPEVVSGMPAPEFPSPVFTAPVISPDTAVKVGKPNFDFSYSWPQAAAVIPKLNAYFEALAATALQELEVAYTGDERLTDPNEEYKPNYSAEYDWKVDAQSGPLLSLSGAWYDYTGGAHGMYGVHAFVFDVKNDSIVASNGVIGNTDAFRSAMEEEFCRLLDTEREKRRGEPVSRDDFFGDCISPLDQTVIWKSSDGVDAFNRVEIFIGPYSAGSYAEGAYVLNLPITPEMKAAIHPQYQDYFAVSVGNPYAVEDQ